MESRLDWWLFALKNLPNFEEIPEVLKKDAIFQKIFEVAALTNLNTDEMNAYQLALKDYRDYYNCLDYARGEGFEKGELIGTKNGIVRGIEQGKQIGQQEKARQIAINLLNINLPGEKVAEATGLPLNEINELKLV